MTPLIGLSRRVFSRLQSKRNTCNSNKVQSPIKFNSKHTTFFTPPFYDKAVQAAKQILGGKIPQHIQTLRKKFPKGEGTDKYSRLAQALLNGWVSTEMINSLSSRYLFPPPQKNSGPLKGCLVQNIGEESVATRALKELGACVTESQNSSQVAIKSHLIIGFGIQLNGYFTDVPQTNSPIQLFLNRFFEGQLQIARSIVDDNGLLYITVTPFKRVNQKSYFDNKNNSYYEHFQKAGWEIRLHHANSGLIIASPIEGFELPDPKNEPTTIVEIKRESWRTPLDVG